MQYSWLYGVNRSAALHDMSWTGAAGFKRSKEVRVADGRSEHGIAIHLERAMQTSRELLPVDRWWLGASHHSSLSAETVGRKHTGVNTASGSQHNEETIRLHMHKGLRQLPDVHSSTRV